MIEYNYPKNDVNRFSVNDIITFIFDFINKKIPEKWESFCSIISLYNGEVEGIESIIDYVDIAEGSKALIEIYIMGLMHFSFKDLSLQAMRFLEEDDLKNDIHIQLILYPNRSGKLLFLAPKGLDCPSGPLILENQIAGLVCQKR